MISFSLCFDNNYAKYALGTLFWLTEHHTDGLSVNIAYLEDVEEQTREAWRNWEKETSWLTINEYEITADFDRSLSRFNHANETKPWISNATFYRLFLGSWFDDKKTIYVDVDTLCTGNAQELFNLGVDGHGFAGVLEIVFQKEPVNILPYGKQDLIDTYGLDKVFMAGVMLMDLGEFTKEKIFPKLEDLRKKDKLHNHDMSLINYSFGDTAIEAPRRFGEADLAYGMGYEDLPHDNVFYQFMFSTKPWAKEGKYATKFRHRDLKEIFLYGMNIILFSSGMRQYSLADFK